MVLRACISRPDQPVVLGLRKMEAKGDEGKYIKRGPGIWFRYLVGEGFMMSPGGKDKLLIVYNVF